MPWNMMCLRYSVTRTILGHVHNTQEEQELDLRGKLDWWKKGAGRRGVRGVMKTANVVSQYWMCGYVCAVAAQFAMVESSWDRGKAWIDTHVYTGRKVRWREQDGIGRGCESGFGMRRKTPTEAKWQTNELLVVSIRCVTPCALVGCNRGSSRLGYRIFVGALHSTIAPIRNVLVFLELLQHIVRLCYYKIASNLVFLAEHCVTAQWGDMKLK